MCTSPPEVLTMHLPKSGKNQTFSLSRVAAEIPAGVVVLVEEAAAVLERQAVVLERQVVVLERQAVVLEQQVVVDLVVVDLVVAVVVAIPARAEWQNYNITLARSERCWWPPSIRFGSVARMVACLLRSVGILLMQEINRVEMPDGLPALVRVA